MSAEPLAAAELARIEAREKAATLGPWAWESVGEKDNLWCLGVTYPAHQGQIIEEYDEENGRFLDKPEVVDAIAQSMSDGTFADAAFIAHARADIPRLIATVRATKRQTECAIVSDIAAILHEHRCAGESLFDAMLAYVDELAHRSDGSG